MTRRLAREQAVILLYQMDIHKDKDPFVFFLERVKEENPEIIYIRSTVDGVSLHLDKIVQLISQNLKNWKLERISKMNLSILKVAVYELLEAKDIPASVAINEAVELAKKFDSPEAGAFVNGVLGSIEKQISGEKA